MVLNETEKKVLIFQEKLYYGFYFQHKDTSKPLNKPGIVKIHYNKSIGSGKSGGNSKT